MKTTDTSVSSTSSIINSQEPLPGKIVVIGGSGLIGSQAVQWLRQRGHEVIAASPSQGVNTLTGEGLDEALAGAGTLVDVSNSPSFEDKAVMEFFQTSTTRLIQAARAAGVRHYIALSVVGTDRLQAAGYFRAKLVQENLIRASGLPYTIIRATQFFEFIGSIAHAATVGDQVRVTPALMQPIAASDVAQAVAQAVLDSPLNGLADLAGPEAMPMSTVVSLYLQDRQDPRSVVADAAAGYFGTAVDDQSLVPAGAARSGATHLSDWLSRQTR